MEVRLAQAHDAAALADLAKRSIIAGAKGLYSEAEVTDWAGKFGEDMILARIESVFIVVVEEQAALCGFGALGKSAGEIDLVYVTPEGQGRGVGKLLVSLLVMELARSGEAVAWLDSSRNAVPFYESCGFARATCGETKGGLCLRMERNL